MTGKLSTRNNVIYCILYYKDASGTHQQKWVSTGLSARGNKKLAQQILLQKIEEYAYLENEIPQAKKVKKNTPCDILWLDWLKDYISSIANTLSAHQKYIYENSFCKVFNLFWGEKKLLLSNVTTKDLLDFFDYLRNVRGIKNTTIKKYTCVLRPALKKAYLEKKISENPFDYVPTIKKEKVNHVFYDQNEMQKFFNLIKGHKLELAFKMLSYYGVRRSELVGIKWSSIDFNNNTISINHKVIIVERKIIVSERMKTLDSNRTLPLIPIMKQELLKQKEKIEENRRLFGKDYNTDYLDFVFVNEKGDLIKPDHISHSFSDFIKEKNLKKIRLHDLRHSCASIMLANGVQMKQIQEWLGHSNFSTTADVYSHLDFTAKIDSANKIALALETKKEKDTSMDIELLKEKMKTMGINSIEELFLLLNKN